MKPTKEYHARYRAANRQKLVEYKKAWNKTNKEKLRIQRLRRFSEKRHLFLNSELKCKFGITLEKYETMLAGQNYRCAICGVPQSELKRRMSVDHDHETGMVRSLLCNHCNTGLGYFKDSSQILTKAIQYLNEHNNKTTACGGGETISTKHHGVPNERGADEALRNAEGHSFQERHK